LLAERRDPVQGAVLKKWFKHQVMPAFDGRVLPVDTALVHGTTVVTRNTADFVPTGVAVLNPWALPAGSAAQT
jgi:hypothetical protein